MASALRGEVLKSLLDAFKVPDCMILAFDQVVNSLSSTLRHLRIHGKTEPAQFWLMFTTAYYNRRLKRVEPKVSVVSFRSTASTVDAALYRGDPYQKVSLDVEYDLIQVSCNDKALSSALDGVQEDALDRGKSLAKHITVDIEYVDPRGNS